MLRMQMMQNPINKMMVTVTILVAGFVAPYLWAAGDNLFEAAISVTPETEQAEQIGQALDAVLVKLTGRRDSPSDPRLSNLRADPQAHLLSFSYQEQLIPDGRFGQRQVLLNAQFIQRNILQALQDQGIELWSLERPEVLLWLAIEDEQRQRDMLAGDDRQHRFVLEQTASQRGLPLVLPVQDQTDYSLVDADTIWGGFYENAAQASERYATDRFVIAAASQRTGQAGASVWQVRWRLPDDESGLETFVSRGADLSEALGRGIHLLADRIAARAMIQSNTETSGVVRVVLQNIQSPAQFAAAMMSFKQMSQVQDVTLLQANDNDIELSLSLSASRDWLLRAIRLADDLSVDTRGTGSNGELRVNVAPQ